MADSEIEWTEKVWNPVRGCALVSPGCAHCYAMGQAHRFSGKGGPYEGLTKLRDRGGAVWTGEVRAVPEKLGDPITWRKPVTVFVNSMSDLWQRDRAAIDERWPLESPQRHAKMLREESQAVAA